MYITGARLLEKYSGDYQAFVMKHIINRASMPATRFSDKSAEQTGHLSQSWDGSSGRRIPYPIPEPEDEFIKGAGGLVSNAKDMVSCTERNGYTVFSCVIADNLAQNHTGIG